MENSIIRAFIYDRLENCCKIRRKSYNRVTRIIDKEKYYKITWNKKKRKERDIEKDKKKKKI